MSSYSPVCTSTLFKRFNNTDITLQTQERIQPFLEEGSQPWRKGVPTIFPHSNALIVQKNGVSNPGILPMDQSLQQQRSTNILDSILIGVLCHFQNYLAI